MEQPTDEFLCSNLEYLATLEPPCIAPSLPLLPNGCGLLPDDFQLELPNGDTGSVGTTSIILQVNAVEDVSLPLSRRLREIAPPNAGMSATQSGRAEERSLEEMLRSMENDEPSSSHHGRAQRLLQFMLTDGFTRVIAMEDCRKGCDALRGGVAWGAKLRVFAPLRIRHGVLILESDKTVLLGGYVKELQEFWIQYATTKLHQLSGRPGRMALASSAQNDSVVPATTADGSANNAGNPPNAAPLQPPAKVPPPPPSFQSALPQQQQGDPVVGTSLVRGNGIPTRLAPTPPPPPQSPITASLFTVVAVISEVSSPLTIREGSACAPGEMPAFSLQVTLALPSQQSTDASGGSGNGGGSSLLVDLGNTWLTHLIGMDVESFRALSASQDPDDMLQLRDLVLLIGSTLENFGTAEFHLHRRAVDDQLEIVQVRQLE
uniref:RecQ-mediated genome instability protein 1 n=1 Tax=Trypanosoma congolense (strain IL3000) TaxID=1068625 RepID=G0UJW5_TRYCI|nr:unnamed protein product [Trypanosoma congolense IL3000]